MCGARGGSGATRTPKGLATLTCFRDRLLIQPGRFQIPSIGLAGTIRTCGLRLRRAVLSPLSYDELASTAGFEPAWTGFVDRCLIHSATSTWRHRRDLHPRPPV